MKIIVSIGRIGDINSIFKSRRTNRFHLFPGTSSPERGLSQVRPRCNLSGQQLLPLPHRLQQPPGGHGNYHHPGRKPRLQLCFHEQGRIHKGKEKTPGTSIYPQI